VKEESELDRHFKSEISKFDTLLYPPISNTNELHQRINDMLIELNSFESAYNNIKILSPSIKGNKLIIPYQYKSKIDTAFAYYKPCKTKGADIGINIIPGSGINQSSAMFYLNKIDLNPQTTFTRNDKNYQCNIDDIVVNFGDVFILVKPNEDFLAIHNGESKIKESEFVNHLLNSGGSYTAYYMLQGLALSKYLEARYKAFFVCGLSQGGLAALINSLQSEPDMAIVASGFSVLNIFPHASYHNQYIIPGYKKNYSLENIKSIMAYSKTQFLFTWGQLEKGNFGKETKDKLTAKFFKDLKNVKTFSHSMGHIYHEPTISSFLESYKSTSSKNKHH